MAEPSDTSTHDAFKENVNMAAAPPKPTQRLIIKKMVLENFKSYAGTVEIGPFHKCFSSVVGPNGSGKSNVIDALLFVFGRRAKAIRQGKLSELIHNSENFPDLEYCKVSIYFCDIVDKGEGYDIVPGTEMVVSRKADRRSQSTYYVNDKTVRLEEVTTLLKGRGIDLDHNRFLILQGEVESISMMKPKGETENEEGLLEYLEDLIGSNVYKEPIAERAKELDALNEEKQDKLNKVKAAAKDKDELEPGMREAVQYIHMGNELTRLKNKRWQHFLHTSTREADKCKVEKDAIAARLGEHKKEQAGYEKDMAELTRQYEGEKKEYKKLEAAVQKAKDDFTAFERKDAKFREELKHAKSKLKKMAKQIDEERHTVNQLTAQAVNDEADIARLTSEIEGDQKRLESEEAKLGEIETSLLGKTAVFKEQVETKQKELTPWARQLNELQATHDLLASERDMVAGRAQQVKAQLDEALASQEQARARAAECEGEIKAIQARQGECAKELVQARAALEKVTEEEKKLSGRLSEQRSAVEGYRAAMQANTSKSAVLTALMEEKRSGRIPGIYGRLGDLGVIDNEYDVAITTACGALNNIVVDAVATGQRCLEFLRQKQLGRTTFLILEKQANLAAQMDSFAGAPEGVPRLFDLVQPKDKKFRPAFYYALRDTVVTKDLLQARRVANSKTGRLRAVSLAGELIDTSGTMSGGGARVQRGGMSSKFQGDEVSPKQLQKEEEQVYALEQKLKECVEARGKLETKVAELEKEERTFETRLSKAKMDIPAMKTKLGELEGLIAELKGKTSQTAEEKEAVRDLDAKIALNRKALVKARGAVDELEAEIKALHDKILDIGGVRLKAQKVKVASVQDEIDTKQSQMTKATVSLKTARKKVDAAQAKITKLEKEREETQKLTETMNDEFKRIEEDASKVLKTMQEAKRLMEDKEDILKEWKGKYEEMNATVSELRKLEVDLQEQLGVAERAAKDNSAKARHWKDELKMLKLDRTGLDDDDLEGADLPMYVAEELEAIDAKEWDEVDYQIVTREESLKKNKCNFNAIRDYKAAVKTYEQRAAEHERVAEQRELAKAGYDALRKQRLDMFMAGFTVITMKLKEMYQMITLGGDAELELVDSLDPFSEGIVFSVRPPKKSWKNIANLSGGEKTLSSLALVFALHHYKPTPLYVMDEIDAALDFRNVSIVANYIKERTKDAQFVIISLRNNMFELADRLVGIYKTNNHTKTVTINPNNIQLTAA